MSRSIALGTLILIFARLAVPAAAPLRFEKVSDHFYFLQLKTDANNVGAVVTEAGILLIDPPAEPDLPPLLDALKRLSQRPVRWIVHTDYKKEQAGGSAYFVLRGAQRLSSKELWRLATVSAGNGEAKDNKEARISASGGQTEKVPRAEEARNEAAPLPEILFGHQMRLYPDGVEVRLFVLQQKAHTAADVVIYIPAEKVLQMGDLYMPGSYPEIDVEAAGSALGWIDGVKQVIEIVPLLKTAIPPRTEAEKVARAAQEEKSLDELVNVIPARGPRSNLKEMKTLLETAQRLRSEIARGVAAGRSKDAILSLPALGPYRFNLNFDAFAGQLFDELMQMRGKQGMGDR